MVAFKNISFLIFVSLIAFGCKHKFDHKDWVNFETVDGGDERNAMIDDLVKNHYLKGLSYMKLLKLLGEPNQNDTSGIYYRVKEDYGWDVDPVYSKDLRFKLSKDSVVTEVKIIEWEKP